MFGKKGISFLVLLTLVLFVSSIAWAAPKHKPNLVEGGNQWLLTYYKDSSTVHTAGKKQYYICFKYIGTEGTHDKYIWWSPAFKTWNGRAVQEGDQVFMHGDYCTEEDIHDAMQWEITSISMGTGHWQEWLEDGKYGQTFGFANIKLERRGSCSCPETPPLTTAVTSPTVVTGGSGANYYFNTMGLITASDANSYLAMDVDIDTPMGFALSSESGGQPVVIDGNGDGGSAVIPGPME